MTEQEAPYDAIVRAEIAIEILNQARAILTTRVDFLAGRLGRSGGRGVGLPPCSELHAIRPQH